MNYLDDERLSWKAKGLLSYMLILGDGSNFRLKDLCKNSSDGQSAISSGIKELESAGYLTRKQLRSDSGFAGWEYAVCDNSLLEDRG